MGKFDRSVRREKEELEMLLIIALHWNYRLNHVVKRNFALNEASGLSAVVLLQIPRLVLIHIFPLSISITGL
jgi:hypothetical protein